MMRHRHHYREQSFSVLTDILVTIDTQIKVSTNLLVLSSVDVSMLESEIAKSNNPDESKTCHASDPK